MYIKISNVYKSLNTKLKGPFYTERQKAFLKIAWLSFTDCSRHVLYVCARTLFGDVKVKAINETLSRQDHQNVTSILIHLQSPFHCISPHAHQGVPINHVARFLGILTPSSFVFICLTRFPFNCPRGL